MSSWVGDRSGTLRPVRLWYVELSQLGFVTVCCVPFCWGQAVFGCSGMFGQVKLRFVEARLLRLTIQQKENGNGF